MKRKCEIENRTWRFITANESKEIYPQTARAMRNLLISLSICRGKLTTKVDRERRRAHVQNSSWKDIWMNSYSFEQNGKNKIPAENIACMKGMTSNQDLTKDTFDKSAITLSKYHFLTYFHENCRKQRKTLLWLNQLSMNQSCTTVISRLPVGFWLWKM